MVSTYTPNLNLELQGTSDNPGTWGSRLNTNDFTILDTVIGGTQTLSLSSTDITVTTTQSQNNTVVLTGVLTANVNVIFPQIGRTYFVVNNTTGSFTVTLKTSAGGGATAKIGQGQKLFYVLDGTNVYAQSTTGIGPLTSIASTSTTDLGTLFSQNALVTGTTTITSFGSSASTFSPVYRVMFSGALTITANATSLITPSGYNIQTTAGDSAVLQYLGSGNWQIIEYSANSYFPSVQPVAGGFKNLKITTTSNTAGTITADAVTLENSAGAAYRARPVNVSFATGTSGAGGLDTGTIAPSTFYAVFAIYNPTTTVTAALLSLTASSPTLPAGFVFSVRLGWVLTDGASALFRTSQIATRVQYIVGTNPTTARVMASGEVGSVSTPTWVAVAVGAFVPPTAASIFVIISTGRGGSSNGNVILAPNNKYGAQGSSTNPPYSSTASYGDGGASITDMMLESSNIYWASATDDGAPAIACAGWEDNL